MRRWLACLFLLVAPPAAAQSVPAPTALTDEQARVLGDKLSRWFLTGRADSVSAYLAEQVRERIGGQEGIATAAAELVAELGSETLIMETVTRGRGGAPEYWRMSRFSLVDDEPIVVHWMFDAEGRVVSLGFSSLSSTPAAE